MGDVQEGTRLATSDCSPLAQFVLNKRDISEEQVDIMVLAPTDRSFFYGLII